MWTCSKMWRTNREQYNSFDFTFPFPRVLVQSPNVRKCEVAAGYFGRDDSVWYERDPWLWVPLVARPWHPVGSTPRDISCTTDSECIGKNQLSHLYTRQTSNRSFIPTYSCCLFNWFARRNISFRLHFVLLRQNESVRCERSKLRFLNDSSSLNWNCMKNLRI